MLSLFIGLAMSWSLLPNAHADIPTSANPDKLSTLSLFDREFIGTRNSPAVIDLNPRGHRVARGRVTLTLIAKSEYGRARATLVVDGIEHAAKTVPGHPGEYDFPGDFTFNEITFPEFQRSHTRGQDLVLQIVGKVKIRSVIFEVRRGDGEPGDDRPIDIKDRVQCLHNGTNHQPYSQLISNFVGRPGYGYSLSRECNDAVRAFQVSKTDAICNWNGFNFSPYSAKSGIPLGRVWHGHRNSQDCNQSVRDGVHGALCNWTGTGYSIYSDRNGRAIGRADGDRHFGFGNYDLCKQSLQASRNGLVCNWTGNEYSIFSIETQNLVGLKTERGYYGFAHLSGCNYAVSLSNPTAVCNWVGGGYQKFSIQSGLSFGPVYRSLEACAQR